MVRISTRAGIYKIDAGEVLREIAMYPGILKRQICQFHPGNEQKINSILDLLLQQGRVVSDKNESYFLFGSANASADRELIKSVWVLLDFIDRVEYHSASDFPAKIVFFADGLEYEIIYAAFQKEAIINFAMQQRKNSQSRSIVIVDSKEQISALDYPGICGYCTVETDGRVNYYCLKKDDDQ